MTEDRTPRARGRVATRGALLALAVLLSPAWLRGQAAYHASSDLQARSIAWADVAEPRLASTRLAVWSAACAVAAAPASCGAHPLAR